jgi:prepilin-type processing-associated H-X9-DG protein
LIESLVLCGLLVVVLVLLAPALSTFSQRGKMVGCASNIRQLAAANLLYATDNRGTLCDANQFLSVTPQGWNEGSAPWPLIPGVPKDSILVRLGYIKEPKVFLCPADNQKRQDRPDIEPNHYRYLRPANFSYTRNWEVSEMAWPYQWVRLSSIKRPAETAMLLEESELSPMNDGQFWANKFDLLTARHDGRGAIAFFDGHVEFINAQQFKGAGPSWRKLNYLAPP